MEGVLCQDSRANVRSIKYKIHTMEMLLFECFHLMYTNNGMGEERKQCVLRTHPTYVKKNAVFASLL